MENFDDGLSSKGKSSRSSTPRLPPQNHFFGIYQSPLYSSGTSSQNPFPETPPDQTLEAALSRLRVSPSPFNHRDLYSGFGSDSSNGSVLETPINNVCGIAGQGFLPCSLPGTQQTDGGSQRLCSNSINTFQDSWLGSDNEDWESLPPTRNQFSNQNDLLRRGEPSGEFPIRQYSNQEGSFINFPQGSRGVTDGLASKKSNNRRPLWLQVPLDCLCVKDLCGWIVSLAKHQHGCRFLQRKIGGATHEEIDMIFFEVIEHVHELMRDPFGNYVVQKLVEVCSEEQRTQILLMVTQTDFQLVSICLNAHGTRAVQRLLEHLTTQTQISLVMSALSLGVVPLTKDMNGHRIIQHCLKYFSNQDNKCLLNVVADNCYGIGTDKVGCCVLKQCVELSRGELREHLLAQIVANALLLAEDSYGNYVVQHLLELRIPHVTAKLLRQFERNYSILSCTKFGSNVVEKCLVETGEDQSTRIIMELVRSPNASLLLFDPFGNYVIQTALSVSSVSKGLAYDALLNLVRVHYPMLRTNPYGKNILAWLDKRKLHYM